MFFPLLKYLNRQFNVTNYVWKAEIQPKRLKERGERCIHFHFTSDKFIHWKKLQNKWNALQREHGYITNQLEPNSTDIRSVIKENQIGSYIAKYFTKKPKTEQEKVNCKTFGYSRNLANMNCTFKEEEASDYYTSANYFLYKFCKQLKSEKYFTIYKTNINLESQLPEQITKQLKANYINFHQHNNHQKKIYID
jgi:hypothetical protein